MPKKIAAKTKNGPYYKCTACLPADLSAKALAAAEALA